MPRLLLCLIVLVTSGVFAFAADAPSVMTGEELFRSTGLGTNGKSCATCHPGGEGLRDLAAYDDEMLREMINFCIRDAEKGEMLPLDSPTIESLLLYLRSLNN